MNCDNKVRSDTNPELIATDKTALNLDVNNVDIDANDLVLVNDIRVDCLGFDCDKSHLKANLIHHLDKHLYKNSICDLVQAIEITNSVDLSIDRKSELSLSLQRSGVNPTELSSRMQIAEKEIT